MNLLKIYVSTFLFFLLLPLEVKACSVGDECTPKPCLNRVDFFGASSEKSAEYNHHYYDAILVIQPMWGFDEYMAALKKYHDSLPRTQFLQHKFPAAPYKIIENFKLLDAKGTTSGDSIELAMSATPYLSYPITYLANNFLPKTRDVCFDEFNFSNYRDASQTNKFLVFAKQYKEAKNPVIVRLKHIKKHAYEPNKKEALEADLIFSAVLETAETIKKKGKEPRKIVRKYKDVKILKKSEALGAGATFAVHKPFFLFGGGEADLKATVISPSYTHPTGIKRYVKPVYPYPQRNIYYYKQNIEHEDLYELIHVSEDIEWELEQLRKIKSQE